MEGGTYPFYRILAESALFCKLLADDGRQIWDETAYTPPNTRLVILLPKFFKGFWPIFYKILVNFDHHYRKNDLLFKKVKFSQYTWHFGLISDTLHGYKIGQIQPLIKMLIYLAEKSAIWKQ